MSSDAIDHYAGRADAARGPGGAEPTKEESAAAAAVLRLIWGTQMARAMYVMAKLGIADLLADAPMTSTQLAQATQAHEPSLYRVLRLLVIDEAHNVCPAEPEDQLVAVAAEHAVRIAAEGRKFGLYLLISTQRPQKIPDNVLSQADNLVLLRLNSLADAAFAEAAFSFVPPSLIDRSVTFRQGEGLIAGKISPRPALLRFGARITEEGGADVPATWAAARSGDAPSPAP